MCGLVGIASTQPQVERAWLPAARDILSHRGPDGAGLWWSVDRRVGLAHRRLSIIDLSPMGHQPMHLEKFGLSVVFNGEIYNFKELRAWLVRQGHIFRSQSDTEVLLAAYAEWGTGCLEKINGMFAFAIYDAPHKSLFLARDRAGEKPLFYRIEDGSIYFASELKALLLNSELPRLIDPNALDCYLAMGYIPGDQCIFHGYKKVPPAHALSFDLTQGSVEVWQYWSPPELNSNGSVVEESLLLDELEFLLESAVGRQLVADVPVGILLSGGVDSSLVTAMAVRKSNKVRTFSIGFPGDCKIDETPHARLIAQYFCTEHMELVADPITAELLPTLAQQFDEPIVDSSMIPTYLVSRLVKSECTVALGGDGGDELFAGYNNYARYLYLQRFSSFIPRVLGAALYNTTTSLVPDGFRGRQTLRLLGSMASGTQSTIASLFDINTRHHLVNNPKFTTHPAENYFSSRNPQVVDAIQRLTRMDFNTYLPDDILVKVDRSSMLNSLEMRAPLLDRHLIEFAFGQVPSHLKATISEKKILLKRLAKRVLPSGFDLQRKQGFSIPLGYWLTAGPFRELFWDTLLSVECMFDKKSVRNLLVGQDKGYHNSERLFALVQFEIWRNVYKASL